MSSGTRSAIPGPWHLRCAPEASEIRGARRRLGVFLEECGVSAEVTRSALLVTSELLTNALEASPPGAFIELEGAVLDGVVKISVENRYGRNPAVAAAFASVVMPPSIAERGRGLPLVASICARLSITLEAGTLAAGPSVAGPSGARQSEAPGSAGFESGSREPTLGWHGSRAGGFESGTIRVSADLLDQP